MNTPPNQGTNQFDALSGTIVTNNTSNSTSNNNNQNIGNSNENNETLNSPS